MGNHLEFLKELAADDVACGVRHLDITREGVFARATHAEVVGTAVVNASSVHVDFGTLGRIGGSEEDVRAELVAGEERGRFGNDIRAEFVDANILEVDVGYQSAEHFALGCADVALQLGEHGHSSDGRHGLKHIFGPGFAVTFASLGHLRTEVGADDGLLAWVGNQFEDILAIGVYALLEEFALSAHGGKHHMASRLEVFLVDQVLGVGIAAVGLAGDGEAQLSHKIVERISLTLHIHGFVVPRTHLGGVAFELGGKVGIEGLVLLDGVIGRAQQAPSNKVESLQNLIGNIERQHCQKDDVHQVDHLLTRRDRSFLYGHIDGN